MHITIVDDIYDNLEVLGDILSEDFEVKLIQNPLELIPFLNHSNTDLILLDLHMPEINGFDLYRKFKSDYPKLPVVFLSGDGSEQATVEGLGLGADDFIVKPVSSAVLIARLKNKIFSHTPALENSDCINFKDFKLRFKEEAAEVGSRFVQLTPIEFKIIFLLAKNPNTLFSKEEVTQTLWPNTHVLDQNIDTHLSNLRKKLKPFSSHIKTIKSRGYILRI